MIFDKGVLTRNSLILSLPMIPVLMPKMLTTPTRMGDPALVKFIGSIVKRGSINTAVGGGETLATWPDSRPTLAHIKVPVLFVVSADNPVYPAEMNQKMHQDTPATGRLRLELRRFTRTGDFVLVPHCCHSNGAFFA